MLVFKALTSAVGPCSGVALAWNAPSAWQCSPKQEGASPKLG